MQSHFLATVGVFIGLLVLISTQKPTSSAERERRQLPCTHPLRLSLPEHFTHCDSVCIYTTWSSWRKLSSSVVSVPVSQCPSGKAYTEERTRTTTGSSCTGSLRETQSICLPTQEERLILALGLGGSGNNYRSLGIQTPPNPALPPPPPPPSGIAFKLGDESIARCHNTGQICHLLPGIGKRSIKNSKEELPIPKQNIVHSDMNPIPFDWLEHGPRLRSKRQATCGDQSIQHVLFVLDTSGSVGPDQFNRMKVALGKLPTLFCKQVKFAVITFDTYVHLEFCFDCFENTFDGRTEVKKAIEDVAYRGGQTYTGATASCVCQEILQPSCGIEAYPDCLDVVFITDGKSNDPSLKICDEIRCLHNRLGVDTYAIGISSGTGYPSYNRTELDCITNHSDLTSAFEFESFTAFETSIESLSLRLLNALPSSPESCARLDSSISSTGSVPFRK